MTRKDLEQMTQALADGRLDATGFSQLQEELKANAESREFFRQSMEVEMLLVEAMGQPVLPSRARAHMNTLLQLRRRRDMLRALVSAAAVLIIAGIIMALVTFKHADIPTLICSPVPGTEWQVSRETDDVASDIRKVVEGSTVKVLSGSVKMEMESGMVMLLRGPAEVAFPRLNHPVLKHGWLWVDSGESEGAIEVETPHSLIRDIGTRFGVRVREDGLAEVHLVDGLLELTSKQHKEDKLTLKPGSKGVLVSASGKTSYMPLEADPFPDFSELLATEANYRTTLLSQGPAGYWRLDEEVGRKLANEIDGGITGKRLLHALPETFGVDDEEDWGGFPEGNGSIHFSGDERESVIMNLDLPGGVSREEGAVTFWIRRSGTGVREEILWLAGDVSDGATRNPDKSLMHTQLSADGQVEFVIENGKYDIKLSSNFSVTDGRWHHIAATWGPSAVELYVDGRRVERVDDFDRLLQGTVRGRYVRFGKPSQDLLAQRKKSFTGWVDEIALWNRPLTDTEIDHQIQAAKGAVAHGKK